VIIGITVINKWLSLRVCRTTDWPLNTTFGSYYVEKY